jgi:hypothetical protein
MPKNNVTKKLHVFTKLDKKPMKRKGVQYSFESVGVVSNIPGLEGDIVKKYVNGKLKDQKFVTRDKLRKLVKVATVKEEKRLMGGKVTQKVYAKKQKVPIVPLAKPPVPLANQQNKNVLVQNNANLQQLLIEQKNQQLFERQVVAQENMVKAAETGHNYDKGFLALIGIDVALNVFDHLSG